MQAAELGVSCDREAIAVLDQGDFRADSGSAYRGSNPCVPVPPTKSTDARETDIVGAVAPDHKQFTQERLVDAAPMRNRS